MQELQELVEPSQLPVELGGTLTVSKAAMVQGLMAGTWLSSEGAKEDSPSATAQGS